MSIKKVPDFFPFDILRTGETRVLTCQKDCRLEKEHPNPILGFYLPATPAFCPPFDFQLSRLQVSSKTCCISSLHLYPLVLFLSEIAIFAITIGYTSATSMVRLASLPLVLWCMHSCVSMALEKTRKTFWATLYGGISSGSAIHYIEIALNRRSYESRGACPRYTQ